MNDKTSHRTTFKIPPLSEFAASLRNRKWSFEVVEDVDIRSDVRIEAFDLFKEEIMFFRIAQTAGRNHVLSFCNAMFNRKKAFSRRTEEEKIANFVYLVQPQEFKDYCHQLERHDWYFTFSDDHDVYRRGSASEDKLKQIADKNGGQYALMFDAYCNKRSNQIANSK